MKKKIVGGKKKKKKNYINISRSILVFAFFDFDADFEPDFGVDFEPDSEADFDLALSGNFVVFDVDFLGYHPNVRRSLK